MGLNNAVQHVVLLLRIEEVMFWNTDSGISFPYWGFEELYLARHGICWDGTFGVDSLLTHKCICALCDNFHISYDSVLTGMATTWLLHVTGAADTVYL